VPHRGLFPGWPDDQLRHWWGPWTKPAPLSAWRDRTLWDARWSARSGSDLCSGDQRGGRCLWWQGLGSLGRQTKVRNECREASGTPHTWHRCRVSQSWMSSMHSEQIWMSLHRIAIEHSSTTKHQGAPWKSKRRCRDDWPSVGRATLIYHRSWLHQLYPLSLQ